MNPRLATILVSITVAFGLLYCPPAASQGVGVIQEKSEPEPLQITLKFSGNSCETNLNESELLRLIGILGVDVESVPGKMVVTYDPEKLTKQQVMGAVGKKKGGCAASEHDPRR